MAETAKWYVVHTYSGYENKVKQDIEKVVENRKLHDLILEVQVPTETVTEITDGKTTIVQEEAEAVQYIFEEYTAGKSLRKIAENMTARKTPYHEDSSNGTRTW